MIYKDFTSEDKKDENPDFDREKARMDLERINEMIKQESLHFTNRLEKQLRIIADISGL